MKKFILKVLLYLSPITCWFIILGSFADGNTDDNYWHFASRKPINIIMGDSRSSQSINPYVLQDRFPNKEFDNFALNIVQSPYGEIYLNALKKKLDTKRKNGIFILGISPWCLSMDVGVISLDQLPEQHSPLRTMQFYDMNPNYEYLFKNYNKSWYYIYRDRETNGRSNSYLHKNGWMEITVNMEKDSVKKREIEKIKNYQQYATRQFLSQYRLKYLAEIIKYLKPYGKVYLVRIPASEKIMQIEKKSFSDFDAIINQISEKESVPYFNFSNNFQLYEYTDGNHMYKESGRIFTKQIADSIEKVQL